jgi:uncharacterized protein
MPTPRQKARPAASRARAAKRARGSAPRAPARSSRGKSPKPAATPARRAAAAAPRRRASRPPAEQPLGVGVGDAYALKRLEVPPQPPRARQDRGVREMGWAEFGEVARQLAEKIGASFQPEVVLGVVNGGVFLGGALAAPFKAELHTVRVEKRGERVVVLDPVGDVRGKRVLVVDDVTHSGKTLGAVGARAQRGGAAEVRTATLVMRPERHHPDFHALETRDVVVFGWDYQLHGAGPGGGDPGEVGV